MAQDIADIEYPTITTSDSWFVQNSFTYISQHPRFVRTKFTQLFGPIDYKGWDTLPLPNQESTSYIYRWEGIWLKYIHEQPFDITINVVEDWIPDGHYAESTASSVYIRCTTKDSLNLLTVNQKELTWLGKYLVNELMNYQYVNSSNGINVREAPSTSSPVIHRFAHKNPVIVLEKTNKKHALTRDDGKRINSKWVKVFINEKKSGYILETFLTDWKELNPYSIHDHLGLSMQKGEKWFSPDSTNIKFDAQDFKRTKGLSEYVDLEIIDSSTFLKASRKNPYNIQPIESGVAVPSSHYKDDRVFSKKYPLLDSDDSIHIQCHPAEYDYSYHEIGYLPKLDYYVFGGYSFGEFYEFRSAHTGEKLDVGGYPAVSPNAHYLVTFFSEQDPELMFYPPSGNITIHRLDNSSQKTTVHIQFNSWLPMESLSGFVWESENTILLKVIPMSIHNRYWHDGISERMNIPYSYLRMSIRI